MSAPAPLPPLVEPGPQLTADELARYSRHLTLPGVGPEGQRRIRAARILVIGAGGLGAPTLQYLGAAGVGHITVIDDDVVEASNLQRQVLHRTEDIGRPKAESARDALLRLDPALSVTPIVGRLSPENALDLFASHDLVLDGADNFATRYLSNDAAELTGTPLVWGTIFQFSGQASVFWPGRGPMLRDLFPDIPDADSVPSCAEGGVFGVLCASVGATIATEALKLICGIGEPLVGRFWRYDALAARTSELRFAADPARPAVTSLEEVAVACGIASGIMPDGAAPEAEALENPYEVSPSEAAALIVRGDATLLDVREDWEAELIAVDGAQLAPLGMIEMTGWNALDSRLFTVSDGASGGVEVRDEAGDDEDPVDDERELLILCKSGVRSLRALHRLASESARPMRSIAGGVLAWKRDVEDIHVVY